MFKKIEIWILYLVILLSFLFAIAFGILVRQELVGSTKVGWISKAALMLAEIPVLIKRATIGLDLEDRFPEMLGGFEGEPNLKESYLLLSRYDGNAGEGVVELIDLQSFDVLHTWNPYIDELNNLVNVNDNEFKYLTRDANNSRAVMIHPFLTDDRGLLFQSDSPFRKIDQCSNLVFQNSKDNFHHSIEVDNNENIWVLSRIYPSSLPSEKVGREHWLDGGFFDDGIVQLSPNGEILFEKSVSQIFIDNGLEYLLFSVGDMNFVQDPIHINDVQPVDSDTEYWKVGDVFLSLRHQSMILLYRPSSNKIIWKGTGPFFHQHDVNILDDKRISIFNNNSKDFYRNDIVDGHNEIITYNFETNEYTSYLSESLVKSDVRTRTGGRGKILPNGDLFIEESDYARTLYFNADGTLRWSHLNRAKDKNIYHVGWSRIMYTDRDINAVNNFLKYKKDCDE